METIFKVIMALIKGLLILVGFALLLGGGSCIMIMVPALTRSHGGNDFGNGLQILLGAVAVAGVGLAILWGLLKKGKNSDERFKPEDRINQDDDLEDK